MEQIYQPTDTEIQRKNQLLQDQVKARIQHAAQRNILAQKAKQKATGKIVTRAVAGVTGGVGLPIAIIAGKLAGKLGLEGMTKVAILGLGFTILSPFFILLFFPLLPFVFVAILIGTIILFVKN